MHISTDTSTNEWFVTCFSTNRDDLSQWRAYGEGENGYAIGFTGPTMIGAILRNECLLVPVNYDQSTHIRITDAVADATVNFFLQGWKAKQSPALNIDRWTESFLTAWVDDITYLAPALKHSGFSPESEWRIIHRLQPADIHKLVFLQKRTLMSRHLPLTYRAAGSPDDSRLLQFTRLSWGQADTKRFLRSAWGICCERTATQSLKEMSPCQRSRFNRCETN
jgi:hypothetical protein